MLLHKLAKAKSSHLQSPKGQVHLSSGLKRTRLEVFSQLRNADEMNEQCRATEEEIEEMLDQNLFREILGTSDSPLVHQFQIASKVSLGFDPASA